MDKRHRQEQEGRRRRTRDYREHRRRGGSSLPAPSGEEKPILALAAWVTKSMASRTVADRLA